MPPKKKTRENPITVINFYFSTRGAFLLKVSKGIKEGY